MLRPSQSAGEQDSAWTQLDSWMELVAGVGGGLSFYAKFEVVQSRRRSLLGPSPGEKHYAKQALDISK